MSTIMCSWFYQCFQCYNLVLMKSEHETFVKLTQFTYEHFSMVTRKYWSRGKTHYYKCITGMLSCEIFSKHNMDGNILLKCNITMNCLTGRHTLFNK